MANPQPILYVHTTARVAGGEKCLLALLEHLDRRIYAPVVYCPGDGPLPTLLQEHGAAVITTDTMSYVFRRASGPRDVAANARRFVATIAELVHIIQHHDIRLVHAFSTSAFKYVGIGSRLGRRPAVGSMHTILAAPQRTPNGEHVQPALTPRWGIAQLVLNINLSFRQVICVSDAVRRALELQGAHTSKLRTIHNGLDACPYQVNASEVRQVRRQLGVAADTQLIGMIGRFDYGKGHDVLLQSLRLLRDRYPSLRAVIVGDAVFEPEAAMKQQILDMVTDLNLGDRVMFTGWRDDVPRLMAAFDVTAVPSTLPDSFPGVVLESMAAGTPVVGTLGGGAAEVISDGVDGYLVPPQDSGALAHAITRILQDPARRAEMGIRGRRKIAEHFTIERNVQQIEALYREVLVR